MNITPRSAWQSKAQPVTGPAMVLSTVTMLPAHYTAAAKIPADVAAYLRSIQNDYVTNRGYSIGYNFAVDQTGQAWECRGFDIKSAANKGPDSGPNLNGSTIAILCLVDGAQAMNPAMVATFQQLAAEAERRCGRHLKIVGHRDIDATACPGDGIYAQVRAGALAPADPKPDPTPPTPTPPAPINHKGTDMYILQCTDGRQCVVMPNVRPGDGTVGYVMRGLGGGANPGNGVHDSTVLQGDGAGLQVCPTPLDPANYDFWASQQDPK